MPQCPVDTCRCVVDTDLYVMCPDCWDLVPKDLQSATYRTWGARVRAHHAEPAVGAHEDAKTAAIAAASYARLGPQERLDV